MTPAQSTKLEAIKAACRRDNTHKDRALLASMDELETISCGDDKNHRYSDCCDASAALLDIINDWPDEAI